MATRQIWPADDVFDLDFVYDGPAAMFSEPSPQRGYAEDGCPYGFTHCASNRKLLFHDQCVAHESMCEAELFPRQPDLYHEPLQDGRCRQNYTFCPQVNDRTVARNMYGGTCVRDANLCSEPQMDAMRYWHSHKDQLAPHLVARNARDLNFRPALDLTVPNTLRSNVWARETVAVPYLKTENGQRWLHEEEKKRREERVRRNDLSPVETAETTVLDDIATVRDVRDPMRLHKLRKSAIKGHLQKFLE